MSEKTVFLAWQDSRPGSQAWFPVGRLDAEVERPLYRFTYIGGARRAMQEAGFPLLVEFPDLEREYQSPHLFPVFQNRVMNRNRPDFDEYLRNLDLSHTVDPVEILKVNGGQRVTDFYL